MITVKDDKTLELRGLSTDKKPINQYLENGSIFIEMDTSIIYTYDKSAKEWIVLEWNDGASKKDFDEFKEEVEDELEKIKDYSDVKDVVGTYEDLMAYDTSTLNDLDIIEVLSDEEQDHANTMYKWHKDTKAFEPIGKLGPYWTKTEADDRFAFKADEETIEPLPAPEPGQENISNDELKFTVTERVEDPDNPGKYIYQTYMLSLDDLRNRIISNDSLEGDTDIDNAEPGQIVFTEIPDEEEGE